MMRNDTRRIATQLLWEELERLPLGTRISVAELAEACPSIVRNGSGGYEIADRENLHDELGLVMLETDLRAFAEEKGLYVERHNCDSFALRRRVAPGTPLDPTRISCLRLGTFTFLDFESDISFELFEGTIRFWRGMLVEPLEKEVDAGVLSTLADALSAAAVTSWERYYQPEWIVLDGTEWELVIMLDDGSMFESGGANAWPEGYDALVEGLLRLFDGCEPLTVEGTVD